MPASVKLLPADEIAHVPEGLQPSPFYERTRALNVNQQWIEWNGYASAVAYRDAHLEYFATRNTCAVFDVSPMCKYSISGADAQAMLNRLVTRDVTKQRALSVAYNIWCDDNGRIIDDGTLFKYSTEDFMLCAAESNFDWLQLAAVGFDALTITDVSEEIASLALQGPTSCALLLAMGFAGIENIKPFDITRLPWREHEIIFSRTGYTGDLGYEIWLPPAAALEFWDALFATGALYGIQPLGDESLDMARLEAGYIAPGIEFHGALHTVNLGHDHSPFELSLDWMVNFKKPHFSGRSALLAEHKRGPKYRLLRLDIEGNKPALHSILYDSKKCSREVGYTTSAMWSPVVKANIAYALVKAEFTTGKLFAEIYHQKELRWQRNVAACRVVDKPFWSPERARLTPPGSY